MPRGVSAPFRIAVLLNITDQPARDLFGGIGDYAREHGPWQFAHVQRRSDWLSEDLRCLTVDGILAQISHPERERRVRALERPAVNMANVMTGLRFPSVLCDDVAVGRMAREHFAERGFRSLAFCGPSAFGFSRERFAGFAEKSDAPAFWLPEPGQLDSVGAALHRRFQDWLKKQPKPLGVFAATDRYARFAIGCCTRSGIAVPDDVAVLGVNNDPIDCELTDLPVSSIQLDARRQGREAAALLHALLRGAHAPGAMKRVLPERVVTRRSTDVFAIPDEVVVRALRFLRSHLCESIGIDELARKVGVARRTLELRFRRHLDRSPYEELLRLRVNKAREELRVRHRRISEIAENCGFGESRYLDSHFRRATGMTPTDYRRAIG